MSYIKDNSERAISSARFRANSYQAGGSSTVQSRPLLVLYNPSGSGKILHLDYAAIDMLTVSGGFLGGGNVSLQSTLLRLWSTIGTPGGGVTMTPVKKDTINVNSGTNAPAASSVARVLGNINGSDLSSGTPITGLTFGAVLAQAYGARIFGSSTTVTSNYEKFDRIELFQDEDIVLQETEGLIIGYQVFNATLDSFNTSYIATLDWWEE